MEGLPFGAGSWRGGTWFFLVGCLFTALGFAPCFLIGFLLECDCSFAGLETINELVFVRLGAGGGSAG